MKKFISVLSVVLVLAFSCVLTSFAAPSPFVDVPSMTSPPWVHGGHSSFVNVIRNGVSLLAVSPKPKQQAYGYLNVKPVSSTRKYTFRFDVYCTTTDNINTTGIYAKVYYLDPGSHDQILLWESNPSNMFWRDNGYKTVERTVTFPESFQSSTGQLYYSIKNDSDKSTVCLSVCNLHITDMTTADLDSAIDRGAEKINSAIDPSVPYNNFDNGSFKDSANELKEAENALPTVDFNAIDELANSIDVSSYSQAFASINQLFIRVVDTIGITPLIFFACFFGFCIFLIGRKLSGG